MKNLKQSMCGSKLKITKVITYTLRATQKKHILQELICLIVINFPSKHRFLSMCWYLMYLVINTVRIGYVDKLVAEAESDRKKDFEKEEHGEFIEIDNDLYKLLKLTNVFNSIQPYLFYNF